jgi:hypothetical protein
MNQRLLMRLDGMAIPIFGFPHVLHLPVPNDGIGGTRQPVNVITQLYESAVPFTICAGIWVDRKWMLPISLPRTLTGTTGRFVISVQNSKAIRTIRDQTAVGSFLRRCCRHFTFASVVRSPLP